MGLGLNTSAFIAQVITFLILLFVLGKYVYPAMMKTLDQRALTIRQGVENAEKAKQELAQAEQRVQAMLEEARQEAQRTLALATTSAQHVRESIEQQAQERARDILAQAERRIEQEMAQARAELSKQVTDLAILAAERVIGSALDDATHRQLVNEFVTSSRELQC